jgi:hypothetical protein
MSRITTLALALAAISAAAGGASAQAAPAASHAAGMQPAASYAFQTIDNPADPTFNQLLGINDHGTIVGYDGSGADAAHPNKGFSIAPPYAAGGFMDENFPGSAQTQVVAIVNSGNTAGFWVDARGDNDGFIEWNGVFTSVADPLAKGKVKVNQLLGMNSSGIAVGFYNDRKGNAHAYSYDPDTGVFTPIKPPGADSAVATGINAFGDITGFATSGDVTEGFLDKGGVFTEFEVPGSMNTQALGIDRYDDIVGSYDDAAGATHGFVLSNPTMGASFQTIDDPQGIGSTVVNGLNDAGRLVGFYTDAAGNTDGFLAKPTP